MCVNLTFNIVNTGTDDELLKQQISVKCMYLAKGLCALVSSIYIVQTERF